jgi:hypothetical protein
MKQDTVLQIPLREELKQGFMELNIPLHYHHSHKRPNIFRLYVAAYPLLMTHTIPVLTVPISKHQTVTYEYEPTCPSVG